MATSTLHLPFVCKCLGVAKASISKHVLIYLHGPKNKFSVHKKHLWSMKRAIAQAPSPETLTQLGP